MTAPMPATLYDQARFRVCGDCAVLVEYGEGIALPVNRKVHAMARALRDRPMVGIQTVVPAYRTLSIVYDPLTIPLERLKDRLRTLEAELDTETLPPPRTVEIPVCYGGPFGPDLEFVAAHSGLALEEVIHLHSHNPYPIYAVGFAPGFCYLGGLDPRLHAPRLPTPRTRVAAGSVGIAEAQTGVYPADSPGGWRLIGRTPLNLFNPLKSDPFLYQAGDQIRFVPISPADYDRLRMPEAP